MLEEFSADKPRPFNEYFESIKDLLNSQIELLKAEITESYTPAWLPNLEKFQKEKIEDSKAITSTLQLKQEVTLLRDSCRGWLNFVTGTESGRTYSVLNQWLTKLPTDDHIRQTQDLLAQIQIKEGQIQALNSVVQTKSKEQSDKKTSEKQSITELYKIQSILEGRIRELLTQISQISDENKLSESDLKNSLKKSEIEISKLKKDIDNGKNRAHKMSTEMSSLKSQLKSAIDEKEKAIDALDRTDSEYTEFLEDYQSLKGDYEAAKEDNQYYKELIEQAENKIDKLKEQNEELQVALNKELDNVTFLNERMNQLTKELEEIKKAQQSSPDLSYKEAYEKAIDEKRQRDSQIKSLNKAIQEERANTQSVTINFERYKSQIIEQRRLEEKALKHANVKKFK